MMKRGLKQIILSFFKKYSKRSENSNFSISIWSALSIRRGEAMGVLWVNKRIKFQYICSRTAYLKNNTKKVAKCKNKILVFDKRSYTYFYKFFFFDFRIAKKLCY